MQRHILKLFADKDGRIRGWRVPAATVVSGASIGILVCAHMGWGSDSPMILGVTVGIAAVLGALFWIEERCIKPRRRSQTTTDPDDPCPDISPAMKRALAVLAALAISTVMVFMGFRLVREWETLAWPHVMGTVTAVSSFREYNYVVRAELAYDVDGRRYTAKLRPRGMDAIKSAATAARIAEEFRSGSVHPVYYSPKSPQVASLVRGPTLGAVIATITMPTFGTALIFVMVQYARRRKTQPTKLYPLKAAA